PGVNCAPATLIGNRQAQQISVDSFGPQSPESSRRGSGWVDGATTFPPGRPSASASPAAVAILLKMTPLRSAGCAALMHNACAISGGDNARYPFDAEPVGQ